MFGSLASGLRRRELKTTDAGNLSWAALFGQQNSRAGVSVNVDSALKVSTVFACLRVLADGIAQVPLKVYREKADGSKELAKDHPAYRLLSRRPNEWMTSFEFRQVMMFHAALLGNGCAYIGRIRGVPKELIPLVPGSYAIEQASDYTLTYRLTDLTAERRSCRARTSSTCAARAGPVPPAWTPCRSRARRWALPSRPRRRTRRCMPMARSRAVCCP